MQRESRSCRDFVTQHPAQLKGALIVLWILKAPK